MTHQLREQLPHQVRESFQHLRQSYYGSTSPIVGEFSLERPTDPEEIDAMFDRVRSERDIGEATNMTMDQKWGIVYAHEQYRWNQLKKKEAMIKKAGAGTGEGKPAAAVFSKDTPEWYLKKFMDQTITAKHVGSLTVSLRTLPIE
jgi:cytokinesis protein